MINRPTQQDLALNFTVKRCDSFDRKWTDMPLGICKIILKGMSAVTRAIYALGEIKVERSLAVTDPSARIFD